MTTAVQEEEDDLEEGGVARPFLRWVGGKRWLVPHLVPVIREHLLKTNGTYYEPFLGGGAVALALGWRSAVLCDACKPLIQAYRDIQRNAVKVHADLEALAVYRAPSAENFYVVREQFNRVPSTASFLYLMTYCYNGVWRENRSGEMNVPWAKNPNRARPSLDHLLTIQLTLRGVAVPSGQDFMGILRHTGEGDLVFADPPYHDTFDGYGTDGFGVADHERLARELQRVHRKGAAVVTINNDTPLVRSLYTSWASLEPVAEVRSIRPHGDRTKAACVLIRAGV